MEEETNSAVSLQVEWQESTEPLILDPSLLRRAPTSSTSSSSSSDEEDASHGALLLRLARKSDDQDALNKAIQLLQTDKSLLKYRDKDGYSALHRAAYSNNVNLIKFMVAMDADTCALRTRDAWIPLHCASRWGHLDVIQLILPLSDVCALTKGGQSAASLAAAFRHVDVLKTVLTEATRRGVDKQLIETVNGAGDKLEDLLERNGPFELKELMEMIKMANLDD